MVVTLYGMSASPPVRAVQMVINKLNIPDVEYVHVNVLTGDNTEESYLKMNPQHCIPTLKDDDFIIWDSHAIAAYLVSKYAEDDSLNPTEPKQRAIIDQRLHFDSGVLFPALRNTRKPVLVDGAKSYDKDSLRNISVAYDLAEKFLTRPWLAGDSLTVVDICCYATISSLDVILPINAEQYPKLVGWLQRCSKQGALNKGDEGVTLLENLLKSKLA